MIYMRPAIYTCTILAVGRVAPPGHQPLQYGLQALARVPKVLLFNAKSECQKRIQSHGRVPSGACKTKQGLYCTNLG